MSLLTQIAQALEDPGTEAIDNIATRLEGLLAQLYTTMVWVAYPLILIGIVIAGYKYITGDAKGGKSGLIAAIVGLVIFVLARVIIYTMICNDVAGAKC